jgi:multidrug efflux pump subunit AcrA (membrane-fusion protein)
MLALTIGIVLMATSCKTEKGEKADTTVYTITSPEVTTTSITKDYVANIQSQKNIELRSQGQGILQDIYIDEGQTVKAGQPLFRLIIVGAQEEVSKTKAEAEQARIDLQNASTLANGNTSCRRLPAVWPKPSSTLPWPTTVKPCYAVSSRSSKRLSRASSAHSQEERKSTARG